MLIASPEGQAQRRRCAVSPTFATVKYHLRSGALNQLNALENVSSKSDQYVTS